MSYGLVMWLPLFFHMQIGLMPWELSVISGLFDFGGIIGAFVIGWVSDRVGYITPFIVSILAAGVPLLLLFPLADFNSTWMYYLLSGSTGFCIAAAANLILGAVAVGLSKSEDVLKQGEATSTIAGIIDGTGSLGAAIGTIVIGVLATLN